MLIDTLIYIGCILAAAMILFAGLVAQYPDRAFRVFKKIHRDYLELKKRGFIK